MGRTFVPAWCVVLAFFLGGQVLRAGAPSANRRPSSAEALQRLKEGNARFASDQLTVRNLGSGRRAQLAQGQQPFAVILSCADSRVIPELIFDQGLGDLFVLRVAGNIADPAVLASMEYAVEHLQTPLIVVLGHESCGAVKAALDGVPIEGNIGWLVKQVFVGGTPAKESKVTLDMAVRNNALYQTKQLTEKSTVIKEMLQTRRVQIVAGTYSLTTGKVDWIEVPDAKDREPSAGIRQQTSYYSAPSRRPEAKIRAYLPTPDAKLWVEDVLTPLVGTERSFVSPALEEGKSYVYRMKATWDENGKEMSSEKKIEVRAGQEFVVDFRK